MPVIRTEDEWRPDVSRTTHHIQLDDGYAPLRTRQDKHNPHVEASQIQLWQRADHNGAKPMPACSNLKKKTEFVVWIGNFPTQLKGVVSEWFFTGRVASNPRIKISSNHAYKLNGNDAGEDVLFTSRAETFNMASVTFENGGDMPWGFNEDIIWSCSFAYEGITVHVSDIVRTPVELYAVSPSLPEYYRSAGVPLELLRLFVGPPSRLNLGNLDEWVAWVVKLCHASIADKSIFDKGVQPGEVPVQDRVHAFVYDIVNFIRPRWPLNPANIVPVAWRIQLCRRRLRPLLQLGLLARRFRPQVRRQHRQLLRPSGNRPTRNMPRRSQ